MHAKREREEEPEASSDDELRALLAAMPGNVKDQLLANVHHLFRILKKSQHRHSLGVLAALLPSIPEKYRTPLTGFSSEYVRKALKQASESGYESFPLFSEAATKTGAGSRPRDASKKDDALAFLREQTQVTKSGNATDRYQSFISRWDTFGQYKAKGGTAGFCIFSAQWKKLRVKKAPHSQFDFFSCTECNSAPLKLKLLEAEIELLRPQVNLPDADWAGPSLSPMEQKFLHLSTELAKLQVDHHVHVCCTLSCCLTT